MATFEFIKTFLGSSSKAGLITISHPSWGSNSIVGILSAEINVSVQTRYGSLIPDISMLSDLASVAGYNSLPTWIGASAQCWKGTDPIQFGADMYLVNYKPGLGLEDKLKRLTKLCTLMSTGGKATAQVHGGYSVDPFANNEQYQSGNNVSGGSGSFFSNLSSMWQSLTGGDKDEEGNPVESSTTADSLGTLFNQNITAGTDITGTLTVSVGSKFHMKNLLLTKIDVSPSLVEVSDGASSPLPLFYKVGMSFMTCRAALENDANGMFGG